MCLTKQLSDDNQRIKDLLRLIITHKIKTYELERNNK